MTANEIRNIVTTTITDAGGTTIAHRGASDQIVLLAEIAAQLAELNETLAVFKQPK